VFTANRWRRDDHRAHWAPSGDRSTRHRRQRGQQPPSKLDQFLDQNLDQIWNPETGLPSFPQRQFDWILDHIEDLETGLALLAKRPAKEAPELTLKCLFWQIQFTRRRDWRAGDAMAVWRAAASCGVSKRPPPAWLCRAIGELCWQGMPDDEKKERRALAKHQLRWEAVELVRGQFKGHPLNRERKVLGDAIWEEAAKLVADTDAKAGADMVRKSYYLIRDAGGMDATLQSYRREVEVRARRHKNNLG